MKKLDDITKLKLIYSGELMFFAILFLVIGILQMVGVITISTNFLNIFKYVVLVGAIFFLYDFISTFTNKKKRAKACLVDKFSTIFIPPYTLTLSILIFTKNEFVLNNPKYFIAPLLFAVSAVYIFQSIYHWFYPLKELLEDEENVVKEESNDNITGENK